MGEWIVREVVVSHSQGIHARPSHAIVATASRFRSRVALTVGDRRADAKSILSVMTLGAIQGSRLKIETQGPDAREAAEALVELVEKDFQEQR
ncbi:MAG: HPr family phosphocarrier protein [Planctomycetota bacterium]